MQDVEFKVDGQTLRGKIFYPEKLKDKNPAVIFIHGWTSDYEGYIPRAEALLPLGYICLIFDLRGHGKSDGKIEAVTAQGSLEDSLAAYDFVASLPEVATEEISVVGSSYGSYIAAQMVDKRDVKSLVLRVPAIYKNETFATPKIQEIDEKREVYQQKALATRDNFAFLPLKTYTGKIILIESEKDQIIPHEVLEGYRHAINTQAQLTDIVMKDADHSLTQEKWRQEYIQILVDWFEKLKDVDK